MAEFLGFIGRLLFVGAIIAAYGAISILCICLIYLLKEYILELFASIKINLVPYIKNHKCFVLKILVAIFLTGIIYYISDSFNKEVVLGIIKLLIGFILTYILLSCIFSTILNIRKILHAFFRYLKYKWIKFKRSYLYLIQFVIITISILAGLLIFGVVTNTWQAVALFFILESIIMYLISKWTYNKITKRFPKINEIIVFFFCVLVFISPLVGYKIIHYAIKDNSWDSSYEQVYITEYGKKYHWDRNCRGLNAANYVKCVHLSKAKRKGYKECKICGR